MRDGRVRFSPWSFLDLPHVSLSVSADRISVMRGDHTVLYLWLKRNRVETACFNFLLTPDQLAEAVAELRQTTGGLQGWIVPGLEYTRDTLTSSKHRPELLEALPSLLEASRDLPVAETWKQYQAKRARAEKTTRGHAKDVPAKPSRGKARAATRPRRTDPRR